MNLVLISTIVGLATMFLIFLVVVTFSTLEDLRLRDWLTLWPYQHWLGEFKSMFDLKIIVVGTVVFSLMIYVPLRTTKAKNVTVSQGKCTCDCRVCKESLRLSKVAIAYLGLDEENIKSIEELLQKKKIQVEAKKVAKPEVK